MILRDKAITGVKWTTLSFTITSILQFIQIFILARILDSSSFGLMAIVMVVIGFAQTFSDMGVSNAIIYRHDTTKNQLSSLYWLNIIAGISVFVILLILTPFIVNFYHQPQLTVLLILTSLVFLITPIGQQFQILLQKELVFDNLAKIDIISQMVGTFITILFAYLGFGVISIVFGQLANTTLRCICLLKSGWGTWHPNLHFHIPDLKNYLNFGMYQMGESTINYFNSNLDNITIGKFIGVNALGFYSFAFNIVLLPIQKINPIINRVAFPVFSKLQSHNNGLKDAYMYVLNIISVINFPIYIGMAVTAPIFIPLIFGNKWLPSIVLLQILVGVGLIRSIGNPIGSLLYAKGLANVGFKWNVIVMFTQVPGIILGAYYGGTLGVAIILLALNIFYFITSYILLIKRVLGGCLKDYLYSIWPAFWMSTIMGIIVWLTGVILSNYPDYILLAIQISFGFMIYVILMIIFYRKILYELLDVILHKNNSSIKNY